MLNGLLDCCALSADFSRMNRNCQTDRPYFLLRNGTDLYFCCLQESLFDFFALGVELFLKALDHPVELFLALRNVDEVSFDPRHL